MGHCNGLHLGSIVCNPLYETTVYVESVYYNDTVSSNHQSIYLNQHRWNQSGESEEKEEEREREKRSERQRVGQKWKWRGSEMAVVEGLNTWVFLSMQINRTRKLPIRIGWVSNSSFSLVPQHSFSFQSSHLSSSQILDWEEVFLGSKNVLV